MWLHGLDHEALAALVRDRTQGDGVRIRAAAQIVQNDPPQVETARLFTEILPSVDSQRLRHALIEQLGRLDCPEAGDWLAQHWTASRDLLDAASADGRHGSLLARLDAAKDRHVIERALLECGHPVARSFAETFMEQADSQSCLCAWQYLRRQGDAEALALALAAEWRFSDLQRWMALQRLWPRHRSILEPQEEQLLRDWQERGIGFGHALPRMTRSESLRRRWSVAASLASIRNVRGLRELLSWIVTPQSHSEFDGRLECAEYVDSIVHYELHVAKMKNYGRSSDWDLRDIDSLQIDAAAWLDEELTKAIERG